MDERTEASPDDAPEEPGDEVVDEPPVGAVATIARTSGRWRDRLGLVAIAALTCAAVVIVGRGDDGGGVEVVETGFSVLSNPYDDVAFGVVIENPTDEIAYHTIACVEVRWEDDVDVGRGCRRFTVEVLLPGQRVGFGALDGGLGRDGAEVTGVAVEIQGPATWEDPDDHQRGSIVATNLNVAYSPENQPVVSFDRESDYPGETVRNASAYAVLRDDDGEIIGASGVDLDGRILPNVPVRSSILLDAVLPDIATAEVYVFPSGL